nr:hypothetical protein [Tanacetum cinerariifolium]
MTNFTFADTHNMVAYLSKSNASAGFDQIVDFLNAQVIQYDLMVSPTIYVLCIKQFWATVSIKKANNVVKLQALIDIKKVVVSEDVIQQDLRLDDADGVECLPNEEIFIELSRMGYEKPPPKLTYTSHALTQKVFANMRRVGNGFSRVATLLFASMLVQTQPQSAEEEDDVEVPAAPTPPLQDPIPTPPQAQPATPHASPPQEQLTDTFESFMTLLNTLMETCTTLSQKVA